ncbi:uncharacterized protein LOC113348977 isoform X2 [Papaver somniferum]|uniref:uncharacterized protein LOC113348977 isoform X2 n=1 Tax=Papaver somniferum TaxID=3469 RepID=UPI000E6F8E70|nr:uncharacterized protein LOC113348977 isoform X2 [Papaver somniferum]
MFRDSLGKSQDVYSLNSCQNHMFTGMIDFGLLHMCASSEECFYGGLHFAPVIFNHRKQFEAINRLYFVTHLTQFTSICVISSSDKYTRLIFDRGRECDESVSMDKYNDDFGHKLNLELGCVLKLLFTDSNVFEIVKDGDDYCDNELYVKRTKRSQGTGIIGSIFTSLWFNMDEIMMNRELTEQMHNYRRCCFNSVIAHLILQLRHGLLTVSKNMICMIWFLSFSTLSNYVQDNIASLFLYLQGLDYGCRVFDRGKDFQYRSYSCYSCFAMVFFHQDTMGFVFAEESAISDSSKMFVEFSRQSDISKILGRILRDNIRFLSLNTVATIYHGVCKVQLRASPYHVLLSLDACGVGFDQIFMEAYTSAIFYGESLKLHFVMNGQGQGSQIIWMTLKLSKILLLTLTIVRRLVYPLSWSCTGPSQEIYKNIQVRHKSNQAIHYPYWFVFSTYTYFLTCCDRPLRVYRGSDYRARIPLYRDAKGDVLLIVLKKDVYMLVNFLVSITYLSRIGKDYSYLSCELVWRTGIQFMLVVDQNPEVILLMVSLERALKLFPTGLCSVRTLFRLHGRVVGMHFFLHCSLPAPVPFGVVKVLEEVEMLKMYPRMMDLRLLFTVLIDVFKKLLAILTRLRSGNCSTTAGVSGDEILLNHLWSLWYSPTYHYSWTEIPVTEENSFVGVYIQTVQKFVDQEWRTTKDKEAVLLREDLTAAPLQHHFSLMLVQKFTSVAIPGCMGTISTGLVVSNTSNSIYEAQFDGVLVHTQGQVANFIWPAATSCLTEVYAVTFFIKFTYEVKVFTAVGEPLEWLAFKCSVPCQFLKLRQFNEY